MELRTPEFIVFGTPGCKFCDHATEYLLAADIPFEYVDINEDEDAKYFFVNAMKWETVPQICGVKLDEDGDLFMTPIGGYKDMVDHFGKSAH